MYPTSLSLSRQLERRQSIKRSCDAHLLQRLAVEVKHLSSPPEAASRAPQVTPVTRCLKCIVDADLTNLLLRSHGPSDKI